MSYLTRLQNFQTRSGVQPATYSMSTMEVPSPPPNPPPSGWEGRLVRGRGVGLWISVPVSSISTFAFIACTSTILPLTLLPKCLIFVHWHTHIWTYILTVQPNCIINKLLKIFTIFWYEIEVLGARDYFRIRYILVTSLAVSDNQARHFCHNGCPPHALLKGAIHP
jgi:hypothetical protein